MTRPARLYYGWWIALALAVAETVSWGVTYYSFSVFLIPMEAELGATRTELSLAFSLALLVSGAAAIPIGRWLDRRGARGLMTAGSLLAAGLVWLWSRAGSLVEVYLIFAGLGLAMAAVLYDPAFAVLAVWFERQRRRAMTLLTLVAGLASTIFVPLAGALLEWLGWRAALAALALVLLIVTTPLHALVLRRRPQDLGLFPDGERPAEHAFAPEPPTDAAPAPPSASFWLVTAAFVLGSGVSVAAGVHFIPYLRELGHSATLAAGLAGAVGLMQLPGRVIFAPLGRWLPRAWLSAGSLVLQGAAVLLLAGAPGMGRLLAFVALFGAANGMLTLTRATAVAELYGSARYGRVSGAMMFWITLARAGGPSALALLHDAAGQSYEPALLLMAGLMVVAAVCYLAGERQAMRAQP